MTYSAAERKERVLRELVEARSAVERAASALPASKERIVFLGQWSCRELVAHLIGWDHTNVTATRELLEGKLPSFYAKHDPDWRKYNSRLVEQFGGRELRVLLGEAQRSHRELLALLDGLDASEIIRDRGLRFKGWRVTIERLMLAEARDERKHAEQLLRFAGP
jgi:hypothetical protein